MSRDPTVKIVHPSIFHSAWLCFKMHPSVARRADLIKCNRFGVITESSGSLHHRFAPRGFHSSGMNSKIYRVFFWETNIKNFHFQLTKKLFAMIRAYCLDESSITTLIRVQFAFGLSHVEFNPLLWLNLFIRYAFWSFVCSFCRNFLLDFYSIEN